MKNIVDENVLSLANKVLSHCHAYQDFYKKNNFNKKLIKSIEEFKQLPISDKKSYLNSYEFNNKLYDDSELSDCYMLCSSSGSTGEPTIWPRKKELDEKLPKLQLAFLDDHFQVTSKKTLMVVLLGLGTSTAGMLTAKLCWDGATNKGISVITPGTDISGAIDLIKRVYKYYDQVVIIGYPPLVKETISEAYSQKQQLKDWNLKFALTGENISLEWKKLILKMIESKELNRIMTFYACSESGIIGIETPLTLQINEHCMKNTKLRMDLYGSIHLPSLISYNPQVKYLEIENNEILLTADQPVPLVRYNLHDRGKIITGQEILSVFKKHKIQLEGLSSLEKYLCVFGKNDLIGQNHSITLEDIKFVLTKKSISSYILDYFQFKEQNVNGKAQLKLLVFVKDKNYLEPKMISKIEEIIKKEIKLISKNNFAIKIEFKLDIGQKKFSKGKLMYLLK